MNLPEEANTDQTQPEKDPGNEIETVTPDENVKPAADKENENKQADRS